MKTPSKKQQLCSSEKEKKNTHETFQNENTFQKKNHILKMKTPSEKEPHIENENMFLEKWKVINLFFFEGNLEETDINIEDVDMYSDITSVHGGGSVSSRTKSNPGSLKTRYTGKTKSRWDYSITMIAQRFLSLSIYL